MRINTRTRIPQRRALFMTNAFLSQNFSKPRTLCGSSRDRRGSGGSSSDSLKAFPLSLFFTDAYFPLTYIHIYMCVYATATAFHICNLEIRAAACGDKNKSKSRSQQQQRLLLPASCATERNNTGSRLTHATVHGGHPHARHNPQFRLMGQVIELLRTCNRATEQPGS